MAWIVDILLITSLPMDRWLKNLCSELGLTAQQDNNAPMK